MKKERKCYYLPSALVKKLAARAKKEQISNSELVARLIKAMQ